jgi:hypothetical protein
MIDSSISWTLGIMSLSLFYYFNTPLILFMLFIDGFYETFTKYHIGGILSGSMLYFVGWFYFILIKLSILTFLLIKNYDGISKKYISTKKCLNAMIKLTNLTGMKSDDIVMMEYVNNKAIYIDNICQSVQQKYNVTKTYILNKTTEIVETELYQDVKYVTQVSDYVIENVYDFVKTNASLVGEFIYYIPMYKTYSDKCNSYYTIGSNLYQKSNGSDDIFNSTDLASTMMQDSAPLKMDIDMSNLGDLAGMMSDFLDSFANTTTATSDSTLIPKINFDLPSSWYPNSIYTNSSNIPAIISENWSPDELCSSMILHSNNNICNSNTNSNSKRIDESDYEDETLLDETLLDETLLDETLLDDDISDLIYRGGEFDDKLLKHAFDTVATITSVQNNSKISLKKKNKNKKH